MGLWIKKNDKYEIIAIISHVCIAWVDKQVRVGGGVLFANYEWIQICQQW